MKKYVLDTSALLTLRDDEEGADLVAILPANPLWSENLISSS